MANGLYFTLLVLVISIHPHINTQVTEATMQGATRSSGALTVHTNSHMEGGTTVSKTGVQLLAKGQFNMKTAGARYGITNP